MKALKIALGAAALVAFAQTASAAMLGEVEYARWTNSTSIFNVDLGGAPGDDRETGVTTTNDYNAAATLPGGIPVQYSIHLDRTYLGDGNGNTADLVRDLHWFRIDPTSMGGADEAMADATLNIVTGVDTGMGGIIFRLYKANEAGQATGTPDGMITGEGQIAISGFEVGQLYVMKVSGWLDTDNPNAPGDQSTNVGRYDIVLGLSAIAPIPVPPAALLLLTGLGALVGFGRSRKVEKAAA